MANKVTLSKGIKDILFAAVISLILVAITYLLNSLPDSFFRYSMLVISFSFFIVFIALLIRRIVVMPLVFIAVSATIMDMDLFGVSGIEAVYTFAVMGCIFLSLFYAFNLLMKKYAAPVIISAALVFSLMPMIIGLFISLSLIKNSLYDILNVLLINLLFTLFGSFIALVAWHRFRVIKVMLRMGY